MPVVWTDQFKRDEKQQAEAGIYPDVVKERLHATVYQINRSLKDGYWQAGQEILNSWGEIDHVATSGNEYVITPRNSGVEARILIVPGPSAPTVLVQSLEPRK